MMTPEQQERRREWVYEYGEFNNDYGIPIQKTNILTDQQQAKDIIHDIANKTNIKINIDDHQYDGYTRIHMSPSIICDGSRPDLVFGNIENSIPLIVFGGLMPPKYRNFEERYVNKVILLSSQGIDPSSPIEHSDPKYKIYKYNGMTTIPLTAYNLEKSILDWLFGEDDVKNPLRDLRPLFKHNNIKKY